MSATWLTTQAAVQRCDGLQGVCWWGVYADWIQKAGTIDHLLPYGAAPGTLHLFITDAEILTTRRNWAHDVECFQDLPLFPGHLCCHRNSRIFRRTGEIIRTTLTPFTKIVVVIPGACCNRSRKPIPNCNKMPPPFIGSTRLL